jgi:putative DNA primase/helicase
VTLRPVPAAGGDEQDEPGPVPTGPDGFHFTDVGNAERLVAAHGDWLRYVATWGRWLTWDGRRWAVDEDGVAVTERAKDVPRRLLRLIGRASRDERRAVVSWATRSESAAALAAAVRLARTTPAIAVRHDQLDADPWVLTVGNGAVDLRSRTLLAADPGRLGHRLAPVAYDPEAEAPTFARFLERIVPDPDVRAYLQRFAGYCLTGDVAEHVLAVWWGGGANGKTTLVNVLRALLGDYATGVARDLVMVGEHGNQSHPTCFVPLFRCRLAVYAEPDGHRLDEARVKRLTGDEMIQARRMREDFWEFEPTHKLVLVTNHRPRIYGTDYAIWRRVHLVPFTETIPDHEQDLDLADRIVATELPGVLRWALDGLKDRSELGRLAAPEAVVAATQRWRAESDITARFLADEDLSIADGLWTASSDLTAAHEQWCEANGLDHRRQWQHTLRRLKDLGARPRKIANVRRWEGIGHA